MQNERILKTSRVSGFKVAVLEHMIENNNVIKKIDNTDSGLSPGMDPRVWGGV